MMNYLIVICNLIFESISQTNQINNTCQSTTGFIIRSKNIDCRICNPQNGWTVLVYNECKATDEDLIIFYLKDVANKITAANQVLVLFHVSSLLRSPFDPSISHQIFPEYGDYLKNKGSSIEVWGFHRLDTGVWNTLKDLPSQLNASHFSSFIDKIYEQLYQPVKKLSILKNRIVHLWLPLDIDLQGIREVLRSESEFPNSEEKKLKAIKYLEDVLNNKNNDEQFFRQKLAKLHYIVAGRHIDFSSAKGTLEYQNEEINKCESVQLEEQNKQDLLVDNKSIYDVILDRKKHLIDSQDWQVLKVLSGLKVKNGANEKETIEIIYEPINYENSPILKFMCLLDCMKANIYTIDVLRVIAPFDNWVIKGANPEQISSFHDWFCALNNCLNNLLNNFRERQ